MKSAIKATIAATLLAFSFAMPAQAQEAQQLTPQQVENWCENKCEKNRQELIDMARYLRSIGRNEDADHLERIARITPCPPVCDPRREIE